MEQVIQWTNCAIQGTSEFHQAMTDQVADTLAQLQEDVAAAQGEGRMTFHKQQAVEHRIQAYLYEMLSIMEETDRDVYHLIMNAPTAKNYRLRIRR